MWKSICWNMLSCFDAHLSRELFINAFWRSKIKVSRVDGSCIADQSKGYLTYLVFGLPVAQNFWHGPPRSMLVLFRFQALPYLSLPTLTDACIPVEFILPWWSWCSLLNANKIMFICSFIISCWNGSAVIVLTRDYIHLFICSFWCSYMSSYLLNSLCKQVPAVMAIILAEFHKACIFTVPKHIVYSKVNACFFLVSLSFCINFCATYKRTF